MVRHVCAWGGHARLTLGEVCRRLTQAGAVTRPGQTVWERRVGWGIVQPPASQGTAAFGKTRQEPLRPRRRAQRPRARQAGQVHGVAAVRCAPSTGLGGTQRRCHAPARRALVRQSAREPGATGTRLRAQDERGGLRWHLAEEGDRGHTGGCRRCPGRAPRRRDRAPTSATASVSLWTSIPMQSVRD